MTTAKPAARALKHQLITYLQHGEYDCMYAGGVQVKPSQMSWALWMGAIYAQDGDELDWFANSIAKGCRIYAVRTWEEMEIRLKKICWGLQLRTDACRKIWRKIEELNRNFWEGVID